MPSSRFANLADVDRHARCPAATKRAGALLEDALERRMDGLALRRMSRWEEVRKEAAGADIVCCPVDELVYLLFWY